MYILFFRGLVERMERSAESHSLSRRCHKTKETMHLDPPNNRCTKLIVKTKLTNFSALNIYVIVSRKRSLY